MLNVAYMREGDVECCLYEERDVECCLYEGERCSMLLI